MSAGNTVCLCVEERMLLKPVVTLWRFMTNKRVDQSKNHPHPFKLLVWLCINETTCIGLSVTGTPGGLCYI